MTTRQFDELMDEIIDEKNDRSLIIFSSSIIDDQLYNVLAIFLKKPTGNDDDLLKGDNPISTFSARIKLTYRLGLIDTSFKNLLDTVRKIRNKCAHSIQLNINKSPIKDHINTLKNDIVKRKAYKLTVKRYFNDVVDKQNELKILLITLCVILEAINKVTVKIVDNEQTGKILKK